MGTRREGRKGLKEEGGADFFHLYWEMPRIPVFTVGHTASQRTCQTRDRIDCVSSDAFRYLIPFLVFIGLKPPPPPPPCIARVHIPMTVNSCSLSLPLSLSRVCVCVCVPTVGTMFQIQKICKMTSKIAKLESILGIFNITQRGGRTYEIQTGQPLGEEEKKERERERERAIAHQKDCPNKLAALVAILPELRDPSQSFLPPPL